MKTVRAHTHTHTHTYTHIHTHTRAHARFLSLMTDSRHNTPETGNKSVLCPVFETAVTLSSAVCHTLCAPSRGPRTPSCSLRDQAKIGSSLFHFKVTGGQYVCCVQSFYSCPSHQLGDSHCVHAAGRAVIQLARSSTNSVTIFHSLSLALQPHRSLLNQAVQQTKGLGLT